MYLNLFFFNDLEIFRLLATNETQESQETTARLAQHLLARNQQK